MQAAPRAYGCRKIPTPIGGARRAYAFGQLQGNKLAGHFCVRLATSCDEEFLHLLHSNRMVECEDGRSRSQQYEQNQIPHAHLRCEWPPLYRSGAALRSTTNSEIEDWRRSICAGPGPATFLSENQRRSGGE
jgi:hypothetical protein